MPPAQGASDPRWGDLAAAAGQAWLQQAPGDLANSWRNIRWVVPGTTMRYHRGFCIAGACQGTDYLVKYNDAAKQLEFLDNGAVSFVGRVQDDGSLRITGASLMGLLAAETVKLDRAAGILYSDKNEMKPVPPGRLAAVTRGFAGETTAAGGDALAPMPAPLAPAAPAAPFPASPGATAMPAPAPVPVPQAGLATASFAPAPGAPEIRWTLGKLDVVFADRADLVQVESVTQQGAAASAGLRPGDVVVQFDRVDIVAPAQLRRQAMQSAGKTVPVAVLRDGKRLETLLAVSPGPQLVGPCPAALGSPQQGVYRGACDGNLAHGQGELTTTTADGVRWQYTGAFVRGFAEGRGTLRSSSGAVYEGDWKAGMLEGRGSTIEPDGSRYLGDFAQGHRHGQGVLTAANGDRYDGRWSFGQLHGKVSTTPAGGARGTTAVWVNGQQARGRISPVLPGAANDF
jgi:hypothetical protein